MPEVDFSIWFSIGCYSGLACCMCSIAIDTLYTWLRRKGTTRQLAGAIVTCVVSSLLLLPAIIWFNMRFMVEQSLLSAAEVEVALVYVALCGWCVPISVTIAYCLFTLPRDSATSASMLRLRNEDRLALSTGQPAGEQSDAPAKIRSTSLHTAPDSLEPAPPAGPASFAFDEDTPWGWLEYCNGRFQGQRLALKRSTISIGRGEDNDIWLDDDMASRRHATLSWYEDHISVTDLASLNGLLLNGRRVRHSATLQPGAVLEIGSHQLLFEQAQRPSIRLDQEDPLAHYNWRSAGSLDFSEPIQDGASALPSEQLPSTEALPQRLQDRGSPHKAHPPFVPPAIPTPIRQETMPLAQLVPSLPSQPAQVTLQVRDSNLAGQSFTFSLEPGRPLITLGRDDTCDVALAAPSISRRHAQIVRQADGIYVQDLGSVNGTRVNQELLISPRRLQHEDILCLGYIHLSVAMIECVTSSTLIQPQDASSVASTAQPTAADLPAAGANLAPTLTSPPSLFFAQPQSSGHVPLRLPSKPKPAS